MITLHKIEIVNFRSLTYALIEPTLDGGMTALAGANGTGKTSVVHALAWAMYGITPPDVAVKGLRRQGTDPTVGDECRVTVTFEHDGQIVEATRALKGKNDTTVAYIKVDGVEITNVSAKTAVAWMEKRLGGLDAAGFLTAFMVRQKELDDLVRARPAERKKLIERLAGIERMADAVQRAREAETDARKFAAMLPGSEQEVTDTAKAADGAAQARDNAITAATDAATAADAAASDLTDAQAVYTEAKAAADEADALRRTRDQKGTARTLLVQEKSHADTTLSSKQDAARGGDPAAITAAQADVDTAQATYDRAREAQQQAATLTGRISVLTDARNSTATDLNGALDAVTDAQNDLDAILAAAPQGPAATQADLTAAEAVMEEAATQRATLQAEYRRLTTAITTLTESTQPCCPTCNRDIDDTSAIIDGLRAAVTVVTRDGKAASADYDAAKAAVDDVKARMVVTTAHEQSVQRATTELTNAQQAAERARVAAKAAEDNLTSAVEAAQKANVDGDPQAVKDAEKALTDARDVLTAATAAARAAAEVPALQATVTDLAAKIKALSGEIAALGEAISDLKADPAALTAAATAVEQARTLAQQATADKQTADADVRILTAAASTAQQAADAAQQRLEAKAAALTALQARTATREALEAFRADRLARLAPELAEVTTDLVARMTNGRYVAVDMDENFTPIVTDADGQMRPVSYLSGGEESIVALALRLGIGDVISGSRGGLLVLDEVLAAQDPERRQAMLSAIRDLPGRQVLMINHMAEASDVADKGYLFVVEDSGEVGVYINAGEESAVHIEHALDAD